MFGAIPTSAKSHPTACGRELPAAASISHPDEEVKKPVHASKFNGLKVFDMRLVPPSQSCLLCVPLSSFKHGGAWHVASLNGSQRMSGVNVGEHTWTQCLVIHLPNPSPEIVAVVESATRPTLLY
jgi:hypothetical protein